MLRTAPCFLLAVCLLVSPARARLSPQQLDAVKGWIATDAAERPDIETLNLPDGLTREEAQEVTEQVWSLIKEAHPVGQSPLGPLPKTVQESKQNGKLDVEASVLPLGEHNMPYVTLRREQQTLDAGRPLFLCLHGGGQNGKAKGPHSWPINSREMQAQIQLSLGVYPSEGIYWIPRMADDRLGRWWHYHNQQAIDQVIDHAIMHWGVDPNRVYLLGISEGGYGTDILTPFMADRFAGGCAMAAGVGLGNPPANLRNVAFRTDVGAQDNMFDRKGLAVAFHEELDKLHEADPEGYTHSINVQKGRGHGINYALGPKWMAEHTRTPFPAKVVWVDKPLHKHRRDRFYWVQFNDSQREGLNRVVGQADRDAGKIALAAEQLSPETKDVHPTHLSEMATDAKPLSGTSLTLLLSDELVNLDQTIEIEVNGQATGSVTPSRSAADIVASLAERPDPTMAATCRVEIEVP
ncbi:hypothetical protein NG895_17410 [Aeoliella sp. ICT_H6.2]|uniref:Uncharacterized protein n=1 Tax=Aeoliella straminimaris TaxID=2954799 RepID=A0A9X2FCI2_9BACT|nr:hypothetical protein [Aeoliella straminimaris]MCO6045678.1 hypothetical protein [Aeoliella straminimaris]